MLPVGDIVIQYTVPGTVPFPPLFAFQEDGRTRGAFPWVSVDVGLEVRIPVSKENHIIAGDYYRSKDFKVRCDYLTLVDPYQVPAAVLPEHSLPADPAWEPEAEDGATSTPATVPAKAKRGKPDLSRLAEALTPT